jgi:formylmethanofuran dehydrogenase subunit B
MSVTVTEPLTRSDPLTAVGCPFCGLLCDDLTVAAEAVPRVVANGCARSRALFSAESSPEAGPRIDGTAASLESAVERAAEILGGAAQPLFLCAGTDVAGIRALLELAERTGGVVDHVNGDALMRNLSALQSSGWVGTTLTEVRNRCDLLLVAGSEMNSRFPRFYERCLDTLESLFAPGTRDIVFLGNWQSFAAATDHRTDAIDIAPARLGELFAMLRALLSGRKLRATGVAGIGLERVSALLERLRSARYGVLTWAAADLDFPHAELTVQSMCELVQELNRTTRFSVLPLGGTDGDLTATQATTWQYGYPLRVSFGSGAPEFDPWRYRAQRLLEQREADALVYVSAFDPGRAPPATAVPTILLRRPGSAAPAAVDIPIATPGLHHPGHLFRADNVVAARLRRVADAPWPAAATALVQILARLESAA